MRKLLAVTVVLTLIAALNASAAFYLNVVVDEHGDGFLGLYNTITMQPMGVSPLSYSTSTPDPFNPPAAPPSYGLPSSLSIATGDIRIDNPAGTRQALLRFDSTLPSTMFFYTAAYGIPITQQSSVQYFPSEIAMGGLSPSGLTISTGAMGQEWTPTSGQVGFITGVFDGMTIAGVNYYIVVNGTVSMVPEPGVFAGVSGLAALLLGLVGFKRSR